MAHLALLCPPFTGHLNPLLALGRALQHRGHRVTVVNVLDTEAQARAEGLEYEAIGRCDFPHGVMPLVTARGGMLQGLSAVRYTLADIRQRSVMTCRDAPAVLRAAGVDAVLVDQVEPAGATVAQLLGLPYVTICNALALNREPRVPPGYLPWGYRVDRWGLLRNRVGNALGDRLLAPTAVALNDYRRAWGMAEIREDDDFLSPWAQIAQQPAAFDFPRSRLPACFHYTSPFRLATQDATPFPYDKLSGRPLVYASLGTVQNRTRGVFHTIAAACAGQDVQLVLSLGGGGKADDYRGLPGSPLVVAYAPQLELLARARLTITHAGLNTVLESLGNGVPLVATPITNDQPGVAARIVWTKTGVVVPVGGSNVKRLRAAVRAVLDEDIYRRQATRLKAAIHAGGGAQRAADIVEQVIATGRPVLREDATRSTGWPPGPVPGPVRPSMVSAR